MRHISKMLLEACVVATAIWVFISLAVIVEDKKSLKPDAFQCPHCGTTLQWTDDELWRGYIACRSGWTAATPNPAIVMTNAEWVCTVLTNMDLTTRDHIDNMPMFSVDIDGRLVP